MLAEPHVGERDPRTRGPPAAARRAAGRDRAADHHLHRQRRAHEPAAPAGGPGRRAARRRRRARSRCDCGPAREQVVSATRCSRSTRATSSPGSSSPGEPWSFDRVSARGRAGARGRRVAARDVPAGAAARSAATRVVELDDLVSGSSSTRCARSCASGSGSASATTSTRSRTRCRSSSTASRSGGSGSGCSRASSPARTLRACMQAEIARGTLPPGVLGQPVLARIGRDRRAGGRGGTGARRRSPGDSLDVSVALPDGRAGRHRARRVRGRRSGRVSYSRVAPRDRLARLGAAARADAPPDPERPFESVVDRPGRAGVRGAG